MRSTGEMREQGNFLVVTGGQETRRHASFFCFTGGQETRRRSSCFLFHRRSGDQEARFFSVSQEVRRPGGISCLFDRSSENFSAFFLTCCSRKRSSSPPPD